jgi:hypothetical protein
MFMDNAARIIYGELYGDGAGREKDADRIVNEVLTDIQAAYQRPQQPSAAAAPCLPQSQQNAS